MAFTSIEADMERASELNKLGDKMKDPAAKRALKAAAARLERRGAKKANKLGRKPKVAAPGVVR